MRNRPRIWLPLIVVSAFLSGCLSPGEIQQAKQDAAKYTALYDDVVAEFGADSDTAKAISARVHAINDEIQSAEDSYDLWTGLGVGVASIFGFGGVAEVLRRKGKRVYNQLVTVVSAVEAAKTVGANPAPGGFNKDAARKVMLSAADGTMEAVEKIRRELV